MSSDLRRLRQEIDQIDEQILLLIARRMKAGERVAEVKEKLKLSVRDEGRERKVISKAREKAGKLRIDRDFAEGLMKYIISGTVGRQREKVQAPPFWERVREVFGNYPAQLEVVKVLLRYGLRVREDGEIVCGDMKIPTVQVAREAGVDRRTVEMTACKILKSHHLREVFLNLEPTAYLRGVAGELGLGVIEVIPDDAAKPGIVKSVTEAISKANISIRQVVADDPYLSTRPKLTVITERPVGGKVIEALRKLPYVKSVIVY